MKQKCKIGYADGTSEWIEIFDVDSLKTAEKDIKEIVNEFNSSLRPHEKPRKFISLIKKPKLKLNKKALEVWYIEPDDFDKDYLGNHLSEEQLKKITFIHHRELKDIEGTPDIIFIDTSAIMPAEITGFSGVSLTRSLVDFLKNHKSSLIYICSYVLTWADDYLYEIKENLSNEDLFIKICKNGVEGICEEIKQVLK
jgi:hypothetical protein